MKFLLDAQLPRRLTRLFHALEHEAIHTLDLPKRNITPDQDIIDYAMAGDYIVITKDADFVDAFYLRGQPRLQQNRPHHAAAARVMRKPIPRAATTAQLVCLTQLSEMA